MAHHLPNGYQRKHSSISCDSLDSSEGSSIHSGGSGYWPSASCYENSDASSDCSLSSFNDTSDFDHDQELPAAHLTFDIDDGREESERLRLRVFDELNFREQVLH